VTIHRGFIAMGALEHAAHEPSHSVAENTIVPSNNNGDNNNYQGISL
jgi:hypothetical protein